MPWWVILITYLVALHTAYKWGYKNGYTKGSEPVEDLKKWVYGELERKGNKRNTK